MGYSRKKQTGIEDILFWKPPWNFRICYFTLRNSGENKFLSLEILQNCDTPWKFQGQKPRPMEIPHDFFLNTTGNSSSFFIDPGISTCSFFNTPWTGLAKLGGPARGTMAPPRFFKAKKKINNSNRNKLKIHNITSWIGQSICYYLNFIWFSLFAYVCKACAFFSCYYYRIQLFYLYKIW